MQGIKVSRPRILRSNADSPLTLDQIRSVAPAVFQESAHPRTSESYAYIPTIRVLELMLEKGFHIHEVAQARPYKRDNDPYVKHMIRMRYPVKAKKVGEVVPEIVLINAHDGTARYYLYGGLYRFICSNGLVVGDTFTKLVVAHRGGDITRNRVLEGSYEIVDKQFPAILSAKEQMEQVILDVKQQIALADTALGLRYPNTVPPFKAEQLLTVRRQEDEYEDLWHVMNRIQENVMEGGFESRSFMFQRRTHIRPVERVTNRVAINRGIWDAAMKMLA